MLKRTKFLSGLAVVASASSIVSAVQADEILTATSPAEAEAVSSTTSSQPVTAQDVADAQAVVDEASQVAQAIDTAVATTEQALSEEQATNQDLKESLAKAEAITDETLATAQEAIQSAQEAKETAQEAVTASQAEKAPLEQAVEAQTSVVTSATAEVASAEATVKATEDKIASLESTGTADVAQLQSDVTNLEGVVANDEVEVANAQASLDNAKEASSNRATAIANQQEVVASAEAQVDSTAKSYADAIATKDSTSSALATAQSALDTAKAGTVVTETIQTGSTTVTTGGTATLKDGVAVPTKIPSVDGVVTTDAYIQAIKNYANGTATIADVEATFNAVLSYKRADGATVRVRGNLQDELAAPIAEAYKSWTEVMKYTFSDTDNSTIIKVHDLTKAQRTELSLFYAALVNQLRSMVGTTPVTVTNGSVALADEKTNIIFNTMFPAYADMTQAELEANGLFDNVRKLGDFGNYSDGIVNATTADTTNIVNKIAIDNQFTDRNGLTATMAELKSYVVAGLGQQLYRPLYSRTDGVIGNTDYSTALEVLGLTGNLNSVGISFDTLEVFNGDARRAPSMVTVYSNQSDAPLANNYTTVSGGTTTTTPIYETVSRTVVDQVTVAQAQTAYNTALANDNSAQSALDSAKSSYESAQTAYAEAQAQLNSIIAGTIDISSLETALNTAVAKLEADKVALQSAKEVLALAKASATDKAVALESAKAELGVAKGVLAEKQATLSAEEAKLASLKADLASKETAYQTALAQLAETNSALETVKAELAELEALVAQKPALAEALAISTAKIAELEALLAEQKASQVEASEALAQAQESYALVKAEYDYLMELERLSADNTVTVLEDGTVIAVPKDAPTAPVLPSISLEDWLKAKEAEIVASGQVAVPLVNQAGQVIGYEAQTVAKPQAPVAGKPVASPAPAQTAQGQASLPNTGQASNLLLLAGLGMLGLAVGVRRKY
ncbi:SEC10/PgrA surface exclusion domain-containing protein [Streptococcus suis]|uniref:SEC10/PgrA surface exclusion domain-containing protein n=1 Tax=Streptococcus suis TaxID=1307 RepID=UPI00345C39DC